MRDCSSNGFNLSRFELLDGQMAQANSDILEGFLCPECHAVLKSENHLIAHFQQHSEDQDVLKSLKGLMGKAKRKILKIDEEDLEDYKSSIRYFENYEAEQEIGCITGHTETFREIRKNRLKYAAAETNKLIIRLDKLLQTENMDRKQHEKSVVEWLDGSSVKLCPECAKSFNLTRRQHHCRLCGAVMCSNCSCFLPINIARTLTPTSRNSEYLQDDKQSGQMESLRICSHCMNLLEARRRLQITRNTQPYIFTLYSQLRELKAKVEPSIDIFTKMATSLQAGESTHSLTEAQALRLKIAKEAETLDLISKKIAAIPPDDECPRAIALQGAIRRSVSNYIKDHLLSLSSLPSAEELEEKRSRNRPNMMRTKDSLAARSRETAGWSPAKMSQTEESDPLLQQIQNIQAFIRQAKEGKRHDVVATLEENLRELRQAYSQRAKEMGKSSRESLLD